MECGLCLSMEIVVCNRVTDMSIDGHYWPQWIVQAVHRQPFTTVCSGWTSCFWGKKSIASFWNNGFRYSGGVLLGDKEQQCRRTEFFRLEECVYITASKTFVVEASMGRCVTGVALKGSRLCPVF